MPIKSKAVTGRRELKFPSFEDMLADAEALVSTPSTKVLGNWPLSQLLSHLSSTIENSIDGFPVQAPWFIRLIGPFLKKGMLKNKMAPGIQLPKHALAAAFPQAASTQEALSQLRTAVARTKHERMTAKHPAFGTMTHDEWVQLHLRHAELHLSFATPG